MIYYTSTDLPVAEKLAKAFEAKYPGIAVRVERTGAERVFQRIGQEYSSNIHAVDVVNSSDAAHFIVWKRDGILAPYVPEEVAKFYPAEHRDPDGQFASFRVWLSIIAYNTNLVKAEDAPKSFADLLDPKWKGKIVKAHPGYSGTIMTATYQMQRDLGWSFFEQLAKQNIMQVQSSADPPKKLDLGERAVMADGNEYNIFQMKEAGRPVEPVYATEGSPLIIGPNGIFKDAPQSERGKAVPVVQPQPRGPAAHHRCRRPALGACADGREGGAQAAQGHQDHEGRRRGGRERERIRSRRATPRSSASDPNDLRTAQNFRRRNACRKDRRAASRARLPAATTRKCEDLLIDVVGLCVTARNEDYVRSALAGCDDDGPCTAIGHARTLTAAGAAFVNGTAAHGEDFDDTFEGGPVHAGAVIVPAVLAACERHNPDGRMALIGIAVGTEVLCRLSLVVPKAVHKAGFHPTAVFGAMGAAAGVGAALGLNARQIVDALGIAGSMAGGIIEYLAEGAWTKRLHAGWAAQSGIRAALLARGGFVGPRTVFEGVHGLFHGFAHTTEGDYDALTGDFGTRWVTDTLAFKPYPCGTMAQPYIDCARRLAARGIKPEDVAEIVCEVAEGTVHRLWEPLADKQRPRNGYAAKFAVPYLLATGFVHGGVGLGAFTESAIRDPRVLALAAKVKFVIDPDNPYPNNYTGHIRATLKDGSVIEERQPYLRGGAQEPLTRQDVTDKFALNAQHGGWSKAQSDAALKLMAGLYRDKIDLSSLRG